MDAEASACLSCLLCRGEITICSLQFRLLANRSKRVANLIYNVHQLGIGQTKALFRQANLPGVGQVQFISYVVRPWFSQMQGSENRKATADKFQLPVEELVFSGQAILGRRASKQFGRWYVGQVHCSDLCILSPRNGGLGCPSCIN
jgi:hypothetical protein